MSHKIQLADGTPEEYFTCSNPEQGIPLNALNVTIDRSLAVLNGLIYLGNKPKTTFIGLNHNEVVACLDQVSGNLELLSIMINGKEG